MTVNKNFVLLISGFLLWATQLTDAEVTGRGMMERGVGIHLGTTHSSVAVHKHPSPPRGYCVPWKRHCAVLSNSDIIEVVTNERGSRTTPSCIAFTDSGVLIGEPARDQAATNYERTICGINRLMAKRFDDPDVQSYIKTLPYKIVNIENRPHIEVKFKNGETQVFSPEEICAMILGKMKEIAEAYMGTEIEQASVLVHQSYFSIELRQSIHEAAKMVGLKVVRVTNSHLAAILARRQWVQDNFRVLVYNLGGTAFDVSLLDDDDGLFELKAARGDLHLGGQSFDTRVVDYFINLIKTKYNKDISKDLSALVKLTIECERAKISLSSSDRVMIKIESLADGIMLFEEPLTRETFEELNMDLFNKTIELVREVMNEGEGEVEKTRVDEIVLVGGNARIPKIQHMLKELFGKEPLKDVNPDEALAFAATHISGLFSGKGDSRFDLHVSHSLSAGIETIGGIMTPYVPPGLYLPRRVSHDVTTSHDGQTRLEIKVFEGERPLTKDCHYLGTLELSDLPPAPRGVPKIKVTVEVDIYWNIRVTAEHEASQKTKSITIPVEQRFNTFEKIKQARAEARNFRTEDTPEKTKVVEALKMCAPQAYSMEFAVVNTHDFGAYFSLDHTRVSNVSLINNI